MTWGKGINIIIKVSTKGGGGGVISVFIELNCAGAIQVELVILYYLIQNKKLEEKAVK